MTTALIVVDVQNDFAEGGALPVEGGKRVAEDITQHIEQTEYDLIVASKDWHLPDSTNNGHFHDWPVHCVQSTDGSRFVDGLILPIGSPIVYKGSGVPAYSAFEGETSDGQTLEQILNSRGVTDVVVVGLAYDFCVQETTLGATFKGFKTTVIKSLTASVYPETEYDTTKKFEKAGVTIV